MFCCHKYFAPKIINFMTSENLLIPDFFKIQVFLDKGYDFISAGNDIPNKFFLSD